MGAGFKIETFTIDYSMALIQDLDTQHKVSFSMRFGQKEKQADISSNHLEMKKLISFVPLKTFSNVNPTKRIIYEVKLGDTLETISQQFFGTEEYVRQILAANQHLGLGNELYLGQKIIIPQ